MNDKLILISILFLLLIPSTFAADEVKPYLHQAAVPQHPEIKLYGQYQTQLFPGAATYSFPIEVPPGTNGLNPLINIDYNSQSTQQTVLGMGWSINRNAIERATNGTMTLLNDDTYTMMLDGSAYLLTYNSNDGFWHTETEYFFKIQNLSGASNDHGMYWRVIRKDGTEYRFGYSREAELTANVSINRTIKWNLDTITDTFGNNVSFIYREDPFTGDNGTSYVTEIQYNNEKSRRIIFSYENAARPDRRISFNTGAVVDQSRRLQDLSIYANDELVRRYSFYYVLIGNSTSALSNIVDYGNDNTTLWYNISFSYYDLQTGYQTDSNWHTPIPFSNTNGADYGVRLVDVNNDARMDIVRAYETGAVKEGTY